VYCNFEYHDLFHSDSLNAMSCDCLVRSVGQVVTDLKSLLFHLPSVSDVFYLLGESWSAGGADSGGGRTQVTVWMDECMCMLGV